MSGETVSSSGDQLTPVDRFRRIIKEPYLSEVWLDKPNPMLDGRTPNDLISSTDEEDKVTLERMISGLEGQIAI